MAHALSLLTAVLAATTAAVLGRSALRHWWAQRAGRPYELPVAHTGTALRATCAVVAAAVALAALFVADRGGARPAHTTAQPTSVRAPGAPARAPARPSATPSTPSTPSTPATPSDSAPEQRPRTIAHPAGGVLQQFPDGTRVWLPPQYGYRHAADIHFPVVVAYAAPHDAPDLIAGFAAHARHGLADPFVVVLPVRCDAELPLPLIRDYRIAPHRDARGLLGLGHYAPCAVREALAHPARYRAAAGVAGAYDDLALPGDPRPDSPRTPRTHAPQLLLATPSGDEAAAASAWRLRADLGQWTEVRILDGIAPRRRLLALVAGYFTEKLDGPTRPDHGLTRPDQSHQNHP